MRKILVIGAHPDDETLGLGGALKKMNNDNVKIECLIFTDGEQARGISAKNVKMRQNQAQEAAKILGIQKIDFVGYEDQKLDVIPTIEIAKEIERKIAKFKPDTIFTHFWGDSNQDHKKIFEATNISARPTPNSKIKNFICYETPSSTEWGIQCFKPNYFIDISKTLTTKLRACKKYSKEMNQNPHPRSEKAIIDRASYWGSVSGFKYSEAFIIIRKLD